MAGTIFQDSKLPLSIWFRAMWQVTSQRNGQASCVGELRSPGDFLLLPAQASTPLEPVGASCTILVTTIPRTPGDLNRPGRSAT
jgi:hypothetical protein